MKLHIPVQSAKHNPANGKKSAREPSHDPRNSHLIIRLSKVLSKSIQVSERPATATKITKRSPIFCEVPEPISRPVLIATSELN